MSKESVKFPKGVKVYRAFQRNGDTLPHPIYTTFGCNVLSIGDLVPSNESILHRIFETKGLGIIFIEGTCLDDALHRGSYRQIIR